MSDVSRGRSRGFGRAARRGSPQSSETSTSGEEPSPKEGNGNGNGNDNGEGAAAMRGRGGYSAPLSTIPAGISELVGRGGTTVNVFTNYFKLVVPEGRKIFQYHVTFEPNVEFSRMRSGLLRDHANMFDNAFLFDGQSNIKTLTKLDEDEVIVNSVRNTDNEVIEIKIKFTGEAAWLDIEMFRLYNTQMRRNMRHMLYVLVGQHHFSPARRKQFPEQKIEMWKGLLTAINHHDGGILMVCDTVFKVLRTDTVYEILKQFVKREGYHENARRELGGQIVMTRYNNRTYRVDDIAFDKNPNFVFERRHGSISIKDYYREQYNIEIRDERQPLIQCLPDARQRRAGISEPILLVPELCYMTGLSESMKNNFQLRRLMIDSTRVNPQNRVQDLRQFMNTVQQNETVTQEMRNWGLEFERDLVQLPARILPSQQVLVESNTSCTFQQKTGDFSKEIRSKRMKVPINFSDWVIIVSPKEDRSVVNEFANTINRVCQPMGIRMNRPHFPTMPDERTSTFVEACRSVSTKFKVVVVIVPNNHKDRYDAIKKVLCLENPLPSQVVVARTLSKKQMLMSVCTKIAIQMAVKIGSEAWHLVIPPKGVMVVGYDTYHDTAKKGSSVGAFVCTLNQTLTRYYSRVCRHENREEMSSNFALNFGNGLKKYHELNGKFPEKIVIYRDGVSEGQILHVFAFELQKIKDTLAKIAHEGNVKLAFIIVTKRVHARFFLKEPSTSSFTNPIPGTVVDTVVTRKGRYDFYLVSQSVRQGTVTPTMYNILEDTTNWKAEHQQELAYKLCHLYYNWMGTISVPAPCQYAHKLAYLTGTSLHHEPNLRLSETLFYL